ncbi:MAG: AAA family ATPase [Pseudomonadota bacterium]
MEYYELLNLKKEPFSNSPDPNYLFQSRQHRLCLQRLELSIRLKRGLNVVVGEVGTGKTTLCRQLLVKFGKDDATESYLILEPQVCGPTDFLHAIATHFDAEGARRAGSDAALKEIIKNHLFKSGVEKGKTIVLIIDEGQKMPPFCLEIVRELLNYETNEYKLLQIIIFAQPEFDTILEGHANVADRISMRHELRPMGFRDTQLMIAYRLHQAGLTQRTASPFSLPAVVAIYLASGGYPRKIVNLCHQCVLALLIQNRKRAGWRLVRSCVQRMRMDPGNRLGKTGWSLGVAAVVVIAVGIIWMPGSLTAPEKPFVDNKMPPMAVRGEKTPAMPPAASLPAERRPVELAQPIETAPSESASDRSTTVMAPPLTVIAPTVSSSPTESRIVTAPIISSPTAKTDSPSSMSSAETHSAAADSAADTIGVARLQPNEMLSWLMIKIYGGYDAERLARLLEKNPEIGNPDSIEVGKRIIFPALPVTIRKEYAGNWWVSLADTDRFDEALDIVRRYPRRLKPIRIIPYGDATDGLRFRLVLWEYYRREPDAVAAASAIPVMDSGPAVVIDKWPEKAVLYADPFAGTRR